MLFGFCRGMEWWCLRYGHNNFMSVVLSEVYSATLTRVAKMQYTVEKLGVR